MMLRTPLSELAYDGTFMHGKQSTLLSSARKKSKAIKATNAVTCRRKSRRTASAAKENANKETQTTNKDQEKKKGGKNLFGRVQTIQSYSR